MPSAPRRIIIAVLALALAACAAREPTPQDVRAKRFETLPDKAVVYLFRERLDFTDHPASFVLDGAQQGTTYRGTYFRLELAPGSHRLAGYAGDNGRLDFELSAGALYFIRQSVLRIQGFDQSVFQFVPAAHGRNAVLHSEVTGAP